MNPIAKLKGIAVEAAKAPATVAGAAVGLTRAAAGKGAEAVASLATHTKDSPAPTPTDVEPAPEAAAEPEVEISPDRPVNVTEELGLDPSPVAKPKRPRKAAPKPVTKIDAEADPAHVDATPADVAEAVSHHKPSGS